MLSTIQEELQSFVNRENQVKNDPNLTDVGKRAKLQEIQEAKKAHFKNHVSRMRKEALKAAKEAQSYQLAAHAAGELNTEKFDFSRLDYEAKAIKSAIARAGGDVYAARTVFEKIKASRDPHKIKAAIDIIPLEIAGDEIDKATVNELMQELNNSENLLETEEQARYKSKATEHIETLKEIQEAGRLLTGMVYGENPAAPGGISKRIMENINITDNGEVELKINLQTTDDWDLDKVILEENRNRKAAFQGVEEWAKEKLFDYDIDPVSDISGE
jgi:hypothetical protein